MEIFENMRTEWMGLWKNEYGAYVSARLKLSELKKFKGAVIMLVRKNKYYQKESNRPNYQFMICDSKIQDLENAKDLTVVRENLTNENLIRISDAVRIARDALQDMQYGYSYDDLTVEVERKMYDNVLSAADIIYGDEESVDV